MASGWRARCACQNRPVPRRLPDRRRDLAPRRRRQLLHPDLLRADGRAASWTGLRRAAGEQSRPRPGAYNSPSGRLAPPSRPSTTAAHDWAAWTDLAEARGFSKIGLWGHSLGAVKTIYAWPSRAMLGSCGRSPPRRRASPTARYRAREDGAAFLEYFEQAQQLVERWQVGQPVRRRCADLADRGGSHLRRQVRPSRTLRRLEASAERPHAACWSPSAAKRASTQIKAGSVRVRRAGREGGRAGVSDLPNVTFALIPGADHQYTNRDRSTLGHCGALADLRVVAARSSHWTRAAILTRSASCPSRLCAGHTLPRLATIGARGLRRPWQRWRSGVEAMMRSRTFSRRRFFGRMAGVAGAAGLLVVGSGCQ